jgi:hypothetical protein
MRTEEEAEPFRLTMKEWERLTEKLKRDSGQISRGQDKPDQAYRGLKRRKDGKDGYTDVPKFEWTDPNLGSE